jgi:hypothetical protein
MIKTPRAVSWFVCEGVFCRTIRREAKTRRLRTFFLLKTALFLLLVMASTSLLSETISGSIQDPSGAVIVGARIEITGGELTQPIVLSSDGLGKFASPDLKLATYSVRVTRAGFEFEEMLESDR